MVLKACTVAGPGLILTGNRFIADLLLRLAHCQQNCRFGFCISAMGSFQNHEYAYRIYWELELNIRIKLK